MWWKFKNILFRVFHISFWIQNCKTDYTFDYELRQKITQFGIQYVGRDKYCAKVGDWHIWVVNYPYHFGRLDGLIKHKDHPYGKVLPAPLTRKLIRRRLDIIDRLERV